MRYHSICLSVPPSVEISTCCCYFHVVVGVDWCCRPVMCCLVCCAYVDSNFMMYC